MGRVRFTGASRAASRGQSLVEFALVVPIFLMTLVGIIEFAFVFNAQLAVNFASRDAALLGAESGNQAGADCRILASIERNVQAPADGRRITEVVVFRATASGTPLTPSGLAASPASNPTSWMADVYTRGGSTTCSYPDGSSITVPYTANASNDYPETARCNVLGGCPGFSPARSTVDTIGVRISYRYTWTTGLPGLVAMAGTGYTFVTANSMRMEPVL
jgi:Flp pilus assembly protein TadG